MFVMEPYILYNTHVNVKNCESSALGTFLVVVHRFDENSAWWQYPESNVLFIDYFPNYLSLPYTAPPHFISSSSLNKVPIFTFLIRSAPRYLWPSNCLLQICSTTFQRPINPCCFQSFWALPTWQCSQRLIGNRQFFFWQRLCR